ncbi:MAG: polysaccharide biosynthesis/export family protein [Gammaproteobacteria bacterium]|nr:polysaccharide biosynthesis/export family protein [Gammaproteobacteria bacterium]
MYRIICIVGLSALLCGCGLMPGMDNLNTSGMQAYSTPEKVEINPTLIPITPTLISDQRVSTYFYKIAPSDVIQITVWQHPEFLLASSAVTSTSQAVQGAAGQAGFLVNAKGDIFFPLIGYVHVAGKTVDEIRSKLTEKLKKYVPNPQVSARVADFRGQKVYTLGELGKIGFLPITDQRLTLADALSLSGWMKPDSADTRFIYVVRGSFSNPQIFWLNAKTPDKLLLAEHFSLRPRDILFVSSAPATRWNRALNQLLPTIQAIWYTQAVVKNA